MYELRTSAHFIDKQQLLEQLAYLKQKALVPEHGLFGPDSMFWEVNKYTTSFMGAGRAALLQEAHPWIANAISDHSKTVNDPFGRFRRTFTNVFTMTYGSLDQLTKSCLVVHNIHTAMFGKIAQDSGAFPVGSHYQANEVNAMVWVHATLWETSAKMYELFVRPLSAAEKEQYYQESKLFAHCFGIPEAALPKNWNDFIAYNEAMWASDQLHVTTQAKDLEGFLFSFNPLLKPALGKFRIVTSMMLPERIRDMYELPPATKENLRTYERTVASIRKMVPLMPKRFKYLPPYVEAHRRIKGQHTPDWITGALNKAMVGRANLVS